MMSIQTKASILWIVLLQARQFGIGEDNILYEFRTMYDDLRAKRYQVSHSEVPTQMLTNLFGGDLDREADAGDERGGPSPTKRPRKSNPNNSHPKLRAALKRPLTEAGSIVHPNPYFL